MTGEITLRGEVLPIGGLKEKLLAAHRGGIKTVLIPDENQKDLVEIPDNIKGNLEIKPVKWIDEVLAVALTQQPMPMHAADAAPGPAAAVAPVDEKPRHGAGCAASSQTCRRRTDVRAAASRAWGRAFQPRARPLSAALLLKSALRGRSSRIGCLAQLVERRPYKANVTGSTPVAPTTPAGRPDAGARCAVMRPGAPAAHPAQPQARARSPPSRVAPG